MSALSAYCFDLVLHFGKEKTADEVDSKNSTICIGMATKTGASYSARSQELLDMMEEHSVGVFGGVPSFIVSGKGSTLVVRLLPHHHKSTA